MRKLLLAMLLFFVSMACTGQAQAGTLTYEYWLGVPTINVQALLDHPAYIADLPDGTRTLYVLEGTRDWEDNYGARIAGYIVPPRNGTYTFWVSSDDQGQLFLSSDDNPDNLSVEPIAQVLTNVAESPPSWDEFPEQKSDPVELMAGKFYYFVAFAKEAGGNDSFHVGWQGPGIARSIIGGIYLADNHRLAARNQVPAHRQGGGDSEDVLVEADLAWDSPPIPDPNLKEPIYDVFIGTDPNLPQMDQIGDGITETTVEPGTLEYGTRYYWRVRVRDNAEIDPDTGEPVIVCSGLYRWFETEPATPVITEQPTNQSVFPGETVTLSVEGASTLTITYAWYKTTDPDNSIGGSPIYEIENAQIGSEGAYYCVLSNTSGDTFSDTVNVIIKRLTGQWELDEGSGDVAVDSSGNGNDGTIINGVWTAEGLDFDGSSSYVEVPPAALSNVSSQITVSLWVYGDADTQPRNDTAFYASDAAGSRILNSHLPWGGGDVYWDAGENLAVTGGYDRINRVADPEEYEGVWNCWAFVKDADENLMAIYQNGEIWHSGGGTRTIAPSTRLVIGCGIGVPGTGQNNYYDGMIKDFRVYNYAKTSRELAIQYASDVPGAVICVDRPQFDLTGPDGTPDCKVNMADFAAMAQNWMDCGRLPECIQ